MSFEWKAFSLAEIAMNGKDGMVDGPFGSALPANSYVPVGVPVIRGSNLSKGDVRFKDNEFVFVSEETVSRLSRATCLPEDIVFTKKGTLGQIGIIPSNRYPIYLLSSNQMRLRVNRELVLPEFAYYYLSQKGSIEKIIRDSEHTGVPKINLSYLRKFPICLPPVSEQCNIVSVLKALDDHIALLRETNTTLESIVQALFKSWFVDFDPVHANAGTQAPSLPSEIQNLFPSTFVESPLGLVPEGWGVGRVENVMELAYGKALKASDRVHGDVPVYGSGGVTGCHNESLVNGPSIIVGRKGTVGTLYWEDRDFFPIDTVFYVKPKFSLCFCYYLLKSLPLADMNTDAAVPGLNRNNVYRLEVVMPPEKILMDFDQTVSLLRASIFSNDQKIQHLSELRDTLLPRLISGQLRLPEVEEMLQ